MRIKNFEEFRSRYGGLFKFTYYKYFVNQDSSEIKGLAKFFTKKRYHTKFFLTRQSRVYPDRTEVFCLGYSNTFCFVKADKISNSFPEVFYWDNSDEPIDLLTRMKMGASDRTFTVFSSDDLC